MNFKHLHYFWAAAKAGGIVRAGQQLHVTPHTLSAQIKLLEESLGCRLLQKSGRGVELTAEGRTALSYADQIFSLGAELEAAVSSKGKAGRSLHFRVGIADSVPKAIAYRLLEPALGVPQQQVRLICHEGNFRDLLAQLSVHRLDLVVADEAMSKQTGVKAFNHTLGTTAMSFFIAPELKSVLKGPFPDCLDGAPMLVQGSASAMRQRLDLWLAEHRLRPRLIGEFDDAALLKAFGGEGRGVFMSPSVLEEETCAQYGVEVLGRVPDLIEEFFGISPERRITHPCVAAITHTARAKFLRK
ncbi:transcriptional activator NhaR [Variovorax sp. OV329]|uniref:transcriptional activator NhaR n=1 Tax=Variovorax sp. OV329 TaxID=1882825 RepID=UPI0008E57B17|nr:transcriptional activator NhaR [Variovorax sp. OV329]SFN22890.1 transcriptional regulator, LysR family [Variovorax sp. OV329]